MTKYLLTVEPAQERAVEEKINAWGGEVQSRLEAIGVWVVELEARHAEALRRTPGVTNCEEERRVDPA